MGALYVVVAANPSAHRGGLLVGVFMRAIAVWAFLQDGDAGRKVAIYEAVWMVLNAVALIV
jgi:hypothetical protein